MADTGISPLCFALGPAGYLHTLQTDFGNYYEDIIPEDAEELKNRKSDNSLVLKFALLGFGVAVMLAACITLLILFGEGTL